MTRILILALLCWSSSWTVAATPVSNHDGDTFKIRGEVRVRVLGVNTPEVGQPKADEATAFTARWLAQGPVLLTVCGQDVYGRLLAHVTRGEDNLADALLAAGLGKKR